MKVYKIIKIAFLFELSAAMIIGLSACGLLQSESTKQKGPGRVYDDPSGAYSQGEDLTSYRSKQNRFDPEVPDIRDNKRILSPKQMALLELSERSAGGPAERTPAQDLVHYVINTEESFEAIAFWYTLETENAARIRRTNPQIDPKNLQPGQTVIIPSYMVKQDRVLNSASQDELRKILSMP